jgi:hypothetical protein
MVKLPLCLIVTPAQIGQVGGWATGPVQTPWGRGGLPAPRVHPSFSIRPGHHTDRDMPAVRTPCSRVLSEKLVIPQLVKKFSAFYGTRGFITVFTTAAICPCREPEEYSPPPLPRNTIS